MNTIKFIKLASSSIIALSILTGCSGGSTASGLGLVVGGTWFGTLVRNNAVYATFSMGLSASAEDKDTPFSGLKLIGAFSSSNSCIGGGEIEGTTSGNNINIKVTSANGELILTGITNNSSMGGTWFNTGGITTTIETPTTTTTTSDTGATTTEAGTTTTTETETCNLGGTWNATR